MISFSSQSKISSDTLGAIEKAEVLFAKRKDLGFWQLPTRDENWALAEKTIQRLKNKTNRLVVVGMGGSALGGRCLVTALKGSNVDFVYNTDPEAISEHLTNTEFFKNAHFLFISKSGGTLELACLLALVMGELKKHGRKISDSISVLTENKPSALYNFGKENGCEITEHPMDVGGRFSVFSPVGLVPAGFSGLKLSAIRAGTQKALSADSIVKNLSAYYLQRFQKKEAVSVFWPYSQKLSTWSDWLLQLWAESLAKKTSRAGGVAPSVSVPVAYQGTCDQHSVLQQLMEGDVVRSVCFLRDRTHAKHPIQVASSPLAGFEYLEEIPLGEVFAAQSLSTQEALENTGISTSAIELDGVNESNLAELMMTFELLIGILGEALNINAFDQPGVELGKKITKEKLSHRTRH